jgi:hypothetical protein
MALQEVWDIKKIMERKTCNKQHPVYSRLSYMGCMLTAHWTVPIVPDQSAPGLPSKRCADTSVITSTPCWQRQRQCLKRLHLRVTDRPRRFWSVLFYCTLRARHCDMCADIHDKFFVWNLKSPAFIYIPQRLTAIFRVGNTEHILVCSTNLTIYLKNSQYFVSMTQNIDHTGLGTQTIALPTQHSI